jgi:hypothetical protein
MHGRGLRIAATCALVAAAGLAAAGLAGADGHEGTLTGDGWTAVSLAGTDGTGEAVVEVRGSTPTSVGALVLDGHQVPLGPSVFVFDPFRQGPRATAGAGGLDVVDVDQRDGDVLAKASLTVTWRGTSPGATVVLWSAGDLVDTRWAVDGGEDARVVDATTGADTWLERDGDLGTGAESWGEQDAKRVTLGIDQRTIDDALVGVFDRGTNATDAMFVDRPDDVQACPCSFAGSPSGSYTFVDAGVGAGEDPHVRLAGADVRLPGPAR